MVNENEIRKRSESTIKPMVQEFDNIKGELYEIAENIYPMGKRGINEEVDQMWHVSESQKNDKVLNTVPYDALRKGSAGFLVNLMNPALKWFKLEPRVWTIEGLEDDGQNSTSEYLERLENFIFDIMSKSGSYRAFKKMFEHLLAFGFGCMLVHKDKDNVCKAECLPVGTYALGIGNNGKVNRVSRRFAMTAEELVREFGCGEKGLSNLPEDVIQNWKRGNNSKDGNYIVENLIEPNEETWAVGSCDKLDYGLPKSTRYRSIYWLRGRAGGRVGENRDSGYQGILAIKGFKFNPIIAPRLDCEIGSIYGRGRGHDALNACRALQALMFDELEISSNRAEPPLIASSDLREEGLDLSRGAVTYTNRGEQLNDMVRPILTNPPTSDETRMTAQEFEMRIKETFFLGEFATIDSLKNINSGDKRTAAEINALKSENLLLLGGVVLMLEDEFLDPTVNTFTQYAIDSKAVRAPESAKKWKEGDLVPKYVGNLQLAQRTQELNSTENSINFASMVADIGARMGLQSAATVLDNYDFDRIVRSRHRLVGASDTQLRNKEDVAYEREMKAQAVAEAQAQQEQQAQADMALTQSKAMAQQGRAAQSAMNAGTMGQELEANMLGGDLVASMGGYM